MTQFPLRVVREERGLVVVFLAREQRIDVRG